MYQCKSGRHVWFSQDDADKCCDPQYRHILVLASPDKPLPPDTASIARIGNQLYGRLWQRVEVEEETPDSQ
jgi:hypothetical protein